MKELKNSIHYSLSTLKKLVFTLKLEFLVKAVESNKTRNEVKQRKDTMVKMKSTNLLRQVAPSVTTFTDLSSHGTANSTPPSGGKKELFSDVFSKKNTERHTLTVKLNDNRTAEGS